MKRLVRLAVPQFAALVLLFAPSLSSAQISIGLNVTAAPPELPVYEQPPLPGPGYMWTPGYWSYGADGYYWVPGTWVEPPQVGLLWTPAYWAYEHDAYVFHGGYWAPHIGFYGGINYGFGYGGFGYEGGHWDHGAFAYNRTVNNFGGVNVTNVYSKTVINTTTVTRVSFNGGAGTNAQPTPQERQAMQEPHVTPTAAQTAHEHAASTNRALFAAVNHGRPEVAATAKPGEFAGRGVVHPREAMGNPSGGAGTAITRANADHRAGPMAGPMRGPAGGPALAPAPRTATLATMPGGPPHPGTPGAPPAGPRPNAARMSPPPHPQGHPGDPHRNDRHG